MTATTEPALVPTEVLPAGAEIEMAATHRQLTKAEAEVLTEEIRTSANRLWMLVAIAHDRKAWKALGYASWKHYVAEELGISESRSFQLVDTGRVMNAIAEATGMSPADLYPVPARVVAKVKGELPALKRMLAGAMPGADDPHEAIAAALKAVVAHTPPPTATADDESASTVVICPVCQGGGDLGTGEEAEELAARLERWLKRYVG